MPISDSEGNPQTGDSQEVGQDAEDAFIVGKPRAWLARALGGTDDYGLDFQVQLKANQQIVDIFRVQLKGTRSPIKSASGDYFSIALSASTLRFYSRIVEPVLLVLCDLSVDPDNPTACPLYYVWVRPELRRIGVDSVPLTQQSVTLRVPTANVLRKTTDLLQEIRSANALAEIGHKLDVRIAELRPDLGLEERVGFLQDVGVGIAARGGALLNALADPTANVWPEPDRDSIAWSLRAIDGYLRDGRAQKCASEVERASSLLGDATPVEHAEFFYLCGRSCAMRGDDISASANYKKAVDAQPLAKYLAAWGESELRLRYDIDHEDDYTDLIAAMVGLDPSVLAMKARLLAAGRRKDEALKVLATFEGQDKLAALAMVHTISGDPTQAYQVCVDGLAVPDLPDSRRQLFLLMKARAGFSIAVGYGTSVTFDEILPPSGFATVDVDQLKEAWIDIVATVNSLNETGWANNAEFIADIWAAAASMLGKQEEVVDQMIAVARLKPHLVDFQSAVETIAAQSRMFKEALEINDRIPHCDLKALRRIFYLHESDDHRGCVAWFESHIDKVDHHHQLFGPAITAAMQSANILARTDLVSQWRAMLQPDEALRPYGAVFDYQIATQGPNAEKKQALSALDEAYEALNRPITIALVLLKEFNPRDAAQAIRCLEVASRIKESARLPAEAAIQLGTAMLTLERWDDLLTLSRDAASQFDDNKRLRAFEGLALEKLDRPDEARKVLERMLDSGAGDSLALDTYVDIMVRWGFVDKAMDAAERLLQAAKSDFKKIECVRLLFNLIQTTDPGSPRLYQLAERMGELVDPDDEVQEGGYLTMVLMGTPHGTQPPSSVALSLFQTRFEAFFGKFPNSKILRRGKIDANASGPDLLRQLSEMTGGSDELRALQQEWETSLRHGSLVIPFAWRPKRVFASVRDLVHLWEVAKRAKPEDRQFHLKMIADLNWLPAPHRQLRSTIPLLDLISLLVLHDLGLLGKLFAYFPLVGIAKRTVVEIAKLAGPFGSLWRQTANDLQVTLRQHLAQIRQPSGGAQRAVGNCVGDDESSLDEPSDEVKQLIKREEYQLYSDDATFRVYCGSNDGVPRGICTGDLIAALEDTGALTLAEAGEKFAQLTAWNVGVVLPLKYQIAVIPAELGAVRTVKAGVEVLHGSASFMAMANGMWGVGKDYMEGQRHIAEVLLVLLGEPTNRPESIAAIVGVWFIKSKLRVDSPAPLDIIVNTFVLVAANAAAVDARFSQRIWSAFRAMIEFDMGERMDERMERDALKALAKLCAKVDANNEVAPESKVQLRFLAGLTAGTADHDAFKVAYSDELISAGRKAASE